MSVIFERFTDRARRCLRLAQTAAIESGAPHIATEHLLMGLLLEGEGVAWVVMDRLHVDQAKMADLLRAIHYSEPQPQSAASLNPTLPFTPAAKKVLELSLREALQLGCNYIGTEHVLLGLIREGEGKACTILRDDFGLDLSMIRQTLIEVLNGYRAPGQRLDDVEATAEALEYSVTFADRREAWACAAWLDRWAEHAGPLDAAHPVEIMRHTIRNGS